jgi:hypothetical protein
MVLLASARERRRRLSAVPVPVTGSVGKFDHLYRVALQFSHDVQCWTDSRRLREVHQLPAPPLAARLSVERLD